MTDWTTDTHRETIKIGNRITLVISMREERGWVAALLVRKDFDDLDRPESEASIAYRKLDVDGEDAARAAALHWAREWLGDVVTPLGLGRQVVEDDPSAPVLETLGDLGPWMMEGHTERINSGNMSLRLFLNHSHDHNGNAHGASWQVELFLYSCYGYGQAIASRSFPYGPLDQARADALAWAREQTAKITKAFA